MKLLLDENISYRLIVELDAVYPGSQHVDSLGLHSRSDAIIWEFARDNGFSIVSKDNDRLSRIEAFLANTEESLLILE